MKCFGVLFLPSLPLYSHAALSNSIYWMWTRQITFICSPSIPLFSLLARYSKTSRLGKMWGSFSFVSSLKLSNRLCLRLWIEKTNSMFFYVLFFYSIFYVFIFYVFFYLTQIRFFFFFSGPKLKFNFLFSFINPFCYRDCFFIDNTERNYSSTS